ncbi:hypothetical protein K3U93_10130 [Mycobacterium malmoense]|uniref:Uncharacterized protein n=2 Tax=Mycobacterium malmoense TaxID=1780 RepID=A0ABX3ST55_MYCMA|nr:hypothetical protein BMG05_11555 [Mycobacterium malmoense]ORA81732.1 hypothetical protein BST29_13555 [Mycobacterium malmoense]QZA19436.1 hypothetical protein K3U93_10130 [Mycobacterium malmoense]UNB96190.1 hypothetical protein H5T25_10120 [Mycobacterium malmoense]
MGDMAGYVVEYNRRTHERRITEFVTTREAMEYRLKLEAERTDKNVEIAALVSKSLDTLKQTHSRYFSGAELAAEDCMLT